MRVYLAAAITNPGRDLKVLRRLLDLIEGAGHEVPTRHVASPDARALDIRLSDRELAERDLAWLAESDALIAEVSTPSHGVGIEVAAALHGGVPVLLLRRAGAPVSRLLLGLEGTEEIAYGEPDEALVGIDAFLCRVAAARERTRDPNPTPSP